MENRDYVEKCINDKKSLILCDYEARYGEFAELEKFCIDNNLTFKRYSSAKYEYEGLIRFFSPNSGDHVIKATDNGEPYLKLFELKEYQEKGLSLDEVIEELEKNNGNVPAFELIEEPFYSIELISSGYEWTCPDCDTLNEEIEITPAVTCCKCKKKFMVAEYFHAHE